MLAVFIAENAFKLTGHLPEAQDLKKALAKLVSYLPDKVSLDLATLSDSISFENPAYSCPNRRFSTGWQVPPTV